MSQTSIFEGFKAFLEQQGVELDNTLSESKLWMMKDEHLLPGKYKLSEHVVSPVTGEIIAKCDVFPENIFDDDSVSSLILS